jgi:hypothetical protein
MVLNAIDGKWAFDRTHTGSKWVDARSTHRRSFVVVAWTLRTVAPRRPARHAETVRSRSLACVLARTTELLLRPPGVIFWQGSAEVFVDVDVAERRQERAGRVSDTGDELLIVTLP